MNWQSQGIWEPFLLVANNKLICYYADEQDPDNNHEVKINKAKELLLKGDMNTLTISEKLGFTDSKYFYKVFKEVTGLSTSDFIKIYRN
jgi:YesN/AraC family two-component response regulator